MECPACRAENDPEARVCFTCGAPLALAIRQGTVVAGRYEVLACLGKGGMGTVYRAQDRALDETVALKVLRSELSDLEEMARRFRTEIKLARKVRHRNVCAIHEYGEAEGVRFIAMELVEGTDLRQVVRTGGPLPWAEAFDAAVQVADGLQAVHDAGIVHRDLKTANIMRDARGVVRLMDFGIAKQWAAPPTLGGTASGHIVGTPEYMSPEQARGGKLDQRSDVYALGVVIFELFTGEVPFRGDTPISTILKLLQEPLPLEGRLGARLPPPLVPVLRRAMAKEPDERHGSARELAEALRAVRASCLAAAPPPEATRPSSAAVPAAASAETVREATPPGAAVPAPRASGWRQRRSAGVGTRRSAAVPLAAALAVALVAAGLWLARPRGPEPEVEPSPAPAAAPSVPRPDAVLASAEVPAPTTLPPAAATPATPAGRGPSPRPAPAAAAPVSQAPARRPTVQPIAAPTPRLAAPPTPATAVPAAAPTAVPTAAPTTAPATPAPAVAVVRPSTPEPPPTTVAAAGTLQVAARPWAEVSVDGRGVGATPLSRISLPAGPHRVRLEHPAFEPVERTVVVRPGQTEKVVVDFTAEGTRRR